MTELDKKLIEQANQLERWDYRKIDQLIMKAETKEARKLLTEIRWDKYDLVQETL